MAMMRDDKSDRPGQHASDGTSDGLLGEVQLLNDDDTPMEFVIQVLQEVFGKDRETATRIMLEVHHEGSGICGIYPYDIADAKVTEVITFARQHEQPLQCVLKRSSSSGNSE
jgi:ATP-dependent Clp protease adaptor protein ClpS